MDTKDLAQFELLCERLQKSRQNIESTADLIVMLENVPIFSFPKSEWLLTSYIEELIGRFANEQDREQIQISFAVHPDYPITKYKKRNLMRAQYEIDHGTAAHVESRTSAFDLTKNKVESIDKVFRKKAIEPIQRFAYSILQSWEQSGNHSLGILKIIRKKRSDDEIATHEGSTILEEQTIASDKPELQQTEQEALSDPTVWREVWVDFINCQNRIAVWLSEPDYELNYELADYDFDPYFIYKGELVEGCLEDFFALSNAFYYHVDDGSMDKAVLYYQGEYLERNGKKVRYLHTPRLLICSPATQYYLVEEIVKEQEKYWLYRIDVSDFISDSTKTILEDMEPEDVSKERFAQFEDILYRIYDRHGKTTVEIP